MKGEELKGQGADAQVGGLEGLAAPGPVGVAHWRRQVAGTRGDGVRGRHAHLASLWPHQEPVQL